MNSDYMYKPLSYNYSLCSSQDLHRPALYWFMVMHLPMQGLHGPALLYTMVAHLLCHIHTIQLSAFPTDTAHSCF